MYQKCPICNGTGREYTLGTTDATGRPCSVCNGTKIINEVNGLPPSQYQELTPKGFQQHLDQIGKEFKSDIEK